MRLRAERSEADTGHCVELGTVVDTRSSDHSADLPDVENGWPGGTLRVAWRASQAFPILPSAAFNTTDSKFSFSCYAYLDAVPANVDRDRLMRFSCGDDESIKIITFLILLAWLDLAKMD